MLAQSNHHLLWLREQDHPAVSLPRWQQQVELLGNFYQSRACLILQAVNNSFQVVCARQSQNLRLHGGKTFDDSGLLAVLNAYEGYGLTTSTAAEFRSELDQFSQILSRPIFWPDGELFGCILICDPVQAKYHERLAPLAETAKSLIQAELKHVFLMQQVKMLSVQDEQTCMLNPYGFNLMAPRQLSLSRRFGSHAGIILIEEMMSDSHEMQDVSEGQRVRMLARVIHDNLRDADVSARVGHRQFIILCFIDNESNLDALVSRLKKQIAKEDPTLKLVSGQSYFTPDTQISLEPMQEKAKENLNMNKLEYQKSSH
ncbi:GGDEF domain-containing protein [uncultured Shewanella sp.]|uniref:GGDEF domain-containing protein n=1 Tax=uncultured Shewanella sp. TaxID=173975 RepID=UPI002634F060|nr:GGDEF domain-containing protein [uncultured Shewanella sp.]